jgi:hypothetical protein
VVTSIIIITIAGMAITMTDLTISRYKEQRYRQAQVDLLVATESAANESINWIKNNAQVWEALKNLTVSSSTSFPATTTSTSAVLVSSNLPTGLPNIFPALISSSSPSASSSAASAGVYAANKRNGCSVETKVIKVASSSPVSTWDGSERFIVFATATFGDTNNPTEMRRQRVQTVLTAASTWSSSTTTTTTTTTTSVPTPAFPFTRGLFSINGYDVSGNADTDSWKSDSNGDGIADTPYVAPASYTIGGPNSHGDIGSNGTLGSGAYDTSKVHGTPTPNANATLPTVTYNPPTSGVNILGNITANTTLTGTGSGSTIFKTPKLDHHQSETLTITGTGTVVLYVDGSFDAGNIKFASGSTANLIIYQNDIGGKGSNFNAQTSIGDKSDPKRFMFITAFSGTGAAKEMSLNGGASFSGVVLAPNAGIKFNGNSDFYGAFVAKDFSGNVNGNFSFHYDESLAGLSWGSIMTTVTTTTTTPITTTTQSPPTFAPITWHVQNIGYGSP